MSVRTFVDTNVLVYAVDDAEPAKRGIAERVLASREYGEFVLSTQVLGEFYVTVTRKLSEPVAEAQAAQALDRFSRLRVVSLDVALVKNAIKTSQASQISYWDGLIVAAAARGGCQRMLSEDLSHGQQIGSVCVENPFRGEA